MLTQKRGAKNPHSLRQSPILSALIVTGLASHPVLVSATLAGILTLSSYPQGAQAALLMDLRFDPETNQLELDLPAGVQPQYSVSGPPRRIILDLPNTEISVNTTQVYETGPVRQVKVSQLSQSLARVELELAPDLTVVDSETRLQPVGPDNRWVLRPRFREITVETTSFSTMPLRTETLVTPAPSEIEMTPVSTSTPDVYPLPIETPSSSGFQVPIATFGNPPQTMETAQTLSTPLPPIPSVLPEGPAYPSPGVPAYIPPGVPVTPFGTVPFGQPLPRQPLAYGQSTLGTLDILLPKGTRLSLMYPGTEPLSLEPKPNRQDVLLLQGGVVDTNGNTIIPVNTPITGYFETNRHGSRFVATSMYLGGRTIPLTARSESIDGQIKVQGSSLLRNSGIGGLGIFILSGFSGIGLLAGAAAGAATTVVTSPQPATIAPGQIVEVRLSEDFLLSNLY